MRVDMDTSRRRMTTEEAASFARERMVPDGAFETKEEADKFCRFLNYVTNSEDYVPVQNKDPDWWAFDMWGVIHKGDL